MVESKMLKVTGILMIIGGALNIVSGFISALGVLALMSLLGGLGIVLLLALLVAMAAGVVGLIAGILGVKNFRNPANAGKCVGMGITVLAMYVAAYAVTFLIDASSVSIFNMLVSFILPTLYLVAASQLKNSGTGMPPPSGF